MGDIMEKVTTGLATQYAKAKVAIIASPVDDMYTSVFGPTTFASFMADWMPLFLIVVLPLLCLRAKEVARLVQHAGRVDGHKGAISGAFVAFNHSVSIL